MAVVKLNWSFFTFRFKLSLRLIYRLELCFRFWFLDLAQNALFLPFELRKLLLKHVEFTLASVKSKGILISAPVHVLGFLMEWFFYSLNSWLCLILSWGETLLLRILPICYVFKGLICDFLRSTKIFVPNLLWRDLWFGRLYILGKQVANGSASVVHCDAAFLRERRQYLRFYLVFLIFSLQWFGCLVLRGFFLLIHRRWMAVKFADSLEMCFVKL